MREEKGNNVERDNDECILDYDKQKRKLIERNPLCKNELDVLFDYFECDLRENDNRFDMAISLLDICDTIEIESFEHGYYHGFDDCLDELEPDSVNQFNTFNDSKRYTISGYSTKDFLNFIKSEIPDVYRKLFREFRKIKKIESEKEDDKADDFGEIS